MFTEKIKQHQNYSCELLLEQELIPSLQKILQILLQFF